MYSPWLFPPDMPGDGAARDLVAVFTVVDVPAGLVDRPVRDPRRVVGRPGQRLDPVRSDEVIHGLRVISDRVGTTVEVRAIDKVDLRNADGLAVAAIRPRLNPEWTVRTRL